MRPQYRRRKRGLLAAVSVLVASGVATESLAARKHNATEVKTATPIKHLVIIFGENETFDHYFATYPAAAITAGPLFYAKDDTPSITGLTGTLLTTNPTPLNPLPPGPQ